VLSSPQVAGIAWHGYGGTPGAMLTSAAESPSKGNFVTEHTGYAGNANQAMNDFTEITHVMRSWGKTYVKWNLASDQYNCPHTGGCTVCSPWAL
jgi:glucosylceramidase